MWEKLNNIKIWMLINPNNSVSMSKTTEHYFFDQSYPQCYINNAIIHLFIYPLLLKHIKHKFNIYVFLLFHLLLLPFLTCFPNFEARHVKVHFKYSFLYLVGLQGQSVDPNVSCSVSA